MKVTQWFSIEEKPKHKGAYERRIGVVLLEPGYWNGKLWRFLDGSGVCGIQKCQWRGLAEKP